MTPEEINKINESLWEEIELIKNVSGYEKYCAGRAKSHYTLAGWIKHLKYQYDQAKNA